MKPELKTRLTNFCKKHVGYGCNRCPLFDVCEPAGVFYLVEELEED